jgi:hypothetical protein
MTGGGDSDGGDGGDDRSDGGYFTPEHPMESQLCQQEYGLFGCKKCQLYNGICNPYCNFPPLYDNGDCN